MALVIFRIWLLLYDISWSWYILCYQWDCVIAISNKYLVTKLMFGRTGACLLEKMSLLAMPTHIPILAAPFRLELWIDPVARMFNWISDWAVCPVLDPLNPRPLNFGFSCKVPLSLFSHFYFEMQSFFVTSILLPVETDNLVNCGWAKLSAFDWKDWLLYD